MKVIDSEMLKYSLLKCITVMACFLLAPDFPMGQCSWLDFIFHYAPKAVWLLYLITTWSKEKKACCIYGRHRPTWLLVWRLELLLSKGGLSDPLAVWVCGPPAFTSLHGHHGHLGLAMGMNFIAGNNAVLEP